MIIEHINKIWKLIGKIPLNFWFSLLVVTGIFLTGLCLGDHFCFVIDQTNKFIFSYCGNLYFAMLAISLVLCIAIIPSKVGNIKIGGPDAKVEHSLLPWLGMLFTAGMGTGMIFWGAAEPLYHYMNPPLNYGNKGIYAFSFTFFHWGLHPWSIYTLTAISVGFLGFNLKRGLIYSNLFRLFRRPSLLNTCAKYSIDLVAIIAVFFGVSAAFGMGIILIETGINSIFNLPITVPLTITLIITITIAYMISSFKGLNRGIKVLSNTSIVLSLFLLLYIFLYIPKSAAFYHFIQSSITYLKDIPFMSYGLMNYRDIDWPRNWTLSYWSWWIAWAPFVGTFIAIISKGRTLRELTIGTLIVPTIFSCIWFTVFGEGAITMQNIENTFGTTMELEKSSMVVFELVRFITHNQLFVWLILILVAIFFINSADSATYTLASMSSGLKDNKEPPRYMQFLWGIMFSVMTGLFVLTGGITMLRQITLITVLPFSVLLICLFIYTSYEIHCSLEKQSESG